MIIVVMHVYMPHVHVPHIHEYYEVNCIAESCFHVDVKRCESSCSLLIVYSLGPICRSNTWQVGRSISQGGKLRGMAS